jgi:GNAT superfamily N-acetyltransferase
MNDDLTRAWAFDRVLLERTSTEVVPFTGGTAYFDDDAPLRYYSNLLVIDEPAAAPAERWVAEADRLLDERGLTHRVVAVHDTVAADRLAMGFVDHGYAVDRSMLMVQRDEPDRLHDLSSVEEISFDEVRPLMEEITRREPWATDAETVRQLTDHHGKLARTVGARFFAVRVDGALAGCCELYLVGAEAQIESVDTLSEFRGKGLASTFVLAAAAAARGAGAGRVHLWADADDWPQRWYATLGFRPVVTVGDHFLRRPPDAEVTVVPASSSAASTPKSPAAP